jgi:fatty-acyl-CoA synthase
VGEAIKPRSFLKGYKECGLLGALTLRGIKGVPLLVERGFHPTVLLPLHALNFPEKKAVIDDHDERTYGELRDRVCRFANGLRTRGGEYHDAVLLMMPNGISFLESLFGCTIGSYTSVLTPYRSTPAELEYLAENSNARWIIANVQYANTVNSANLPNIPPERRIAVGGPAPEGWTTFDSIVEDGHAELPKLSPSKVVHSIGYTSGTTGKPKGAKRNLSKAGLPTVLNFTQLVPFHHTDTHLVACPLYHAAGGGMAQVNLVLGATLVLQEKFRPEEWLALVEKYKVTSATLVPTMVHDLVTLPEEIFRKYDVSTMRVIMTSGAPLTLRQRELIRERFGDVLYDMYGSTEWGWLTVAQPMDHVERPGTLGRAVPTVEIRIVNDEGKEVPPGEIGELFARTKIVIDEYHNNKEATLESSLDGFLSVGDLVRMDEDGYLYMADRKSDMVISGGVNLYPPEIESVLSQHPGVQDVAVIGVPDERWGEKLVAYVVPKPDLDLTEDSLVEYAREKLSGPKIPRVFKFVDSIPRSPTGKIRKREMRSNFLEGAPVA